MSYDLWFVKRDAGEPEAVYLALIESQEEGPRAPTPDEEQELRRLAADLQAANPEIDLSEPESGFLLQLGYDAELPVVVDISADEITMSWSYGADDARAALAEARRLLPVFERHGYVAYDPQLERVFDAEQDGAAAEDAHAHVRGRLEETYGSLDGAATVNQPWWKRLLGIRS